MTQFVLISAFFLLGMAWINQILLSRSGALKETGPWRIEMLRNNHVVKGVTITSAASIFLAIIFSAVFYPSMHWSSKIPGNDFLICYIHSHFICLAATKLDKIVLICFNPMMQWFSKDSWQSFKCWNCSLFKVGCNCLLIAEVLDSKPKGKCPNDYDWLAAAVKEVAIQPVTTDGVPTFTESENHQSSLPLFNTR